MINWLIAIFYFLESLGIINLEQMITTNLFLLLICRGFYVITYVNRYEFLKERAEQGGTILFDKQEILIFSLKQVIILLFGMIYFPITLFVSVYSLLMGSSYLREIGIVRDRKMLKLLGKAINIIVPILAVLWFVFIDVDLYSMAAIGIALVAFLHYGLKISLLSLSKLLDKYSKRHISRFPAAIKYLLIFLLIAFPTIIIIGSAIYKTPDKFTVMVPMRDNVKLATDVYYAPGSFGMARPVILVRTTYGKNVMGGLYGALYLTQDYHMVIQDSRGCYDSEGGDKFILFADSYKDGVDTIEWILSQTWCNGKIASIGASALGIDEFFYAGMNPSGLTAQSIMISTPDLYKTSIYQGGAFKESIATGWAKLTAPNNYEYQLNQIISHSMKDIFYNSTSLFMDIGPSFKNVSVAGLHIGGWYDPFQQGTLDGYMGYDDLGLPGAKGRQLLIMGPFTHGMPTEGKQGELTFPTKSTSSFDLYLDWERKLFNYALINLPFDWSGNRVAYYMIGDVDDDNVNANDYRFANDWPVPYLNDTWYLWGDGSIQNNTIPITEDLFSYFYDPTDPVPTLGGTNLLIPSGPYDQRPIENRTDVLIFESAPLIVCYEIVGRIWAHLFIKSNCTNTDFTVKITDVYPDNRSMLISDGIINAARREGFNDTADPLNTLPYAEVDIDLWSTAYQFNAGHKIRIAISSSNYPRFGINPNTGAPQKAYSYQYTTMVIANNTLLTGPSYPSCIILPRPI
jgi:predicted acyl esterase